MADFNVDNPAFESDDWEEDIGGDDVLSTSLHDDMSSEGATIQTSSLQQELLQTAVDDYYNQFQRESLTPALGRDHGKFELVDGRLRLKAYPNVEIVNKRTGAPRALSTVANQPGGGVAIREELGFVDWARKKSSLPAKAVESLQTENQQLGEAAAAVDTVELQDLGQIATETSDAVHRMETALTDADVNVLLGTLNDSPLNLREIQGLDKALQTIRGELTNNLAKLTQLDDHIALERQKLDAGDIDEFSRRRIAECLRDLHVERSARLEAAAANREALRSQINQMRETISRILHEEKLLLADKELSGWNRIWLWFHDPFGWYPWLYWYTVPRPLLLESFWLQSVSGSTPNSRQIRS